ncbi:hypothetical protein L195_g063763, partial [Trifolium pratense]
MRGNDHAARDKNHATRDDEQHFQKDHAA